MESFSEFLRRVHADDVATGKGGLHQPGICAICDAQRERMNADAHRA